MKCGMCGKEIAEQVGREERCGQCSGGCRRIHCPYCGYANPLVPAYLQRFMTPDDKKKE